MRLTAILTLVAFSCSTSASTLRENVAIVNSSAPTLGVPYLEFDREVSGSSVGMAMQWLEENRDEKVVVIEWDSPGGSVFAGFALSKAIAKHPATVVCVVDGMAASMAAYLLESCDVRLMTRDSLIMFHEPSASGAGKAGEFEELARTLRAINEALVAHCVAKMNITEEEFVEKTDGKDWWLSYKKALEFRAVDGVVNSGLEVAVWLFKEGRLPPDTIWAPVR